MVAKRCWILKNSWTRSSESWDQLTHGLHRFCDSGTLLAHVRAGCLAGQSGNTGCQALAVALRDMTLGEVDQGDSRRLLIKQGLLGLLNDICLGRSECAVRHVYPCPIPGRSQRPDFGTGSLGIHDRQLHYQPTLRRSDTPDLTATGRRSSHRL